MFIILNEYWIDIQCYGFPIKILHILCKKDFKDYTWSLVSVFLLLILQKVNNRYHHLILSSVPAATMFCLRVWGPGSHGMSPLQYGFKWIFLFSISVSYLVRANEKLIDTTGYRERRMRSRSRPAKLWTLLLNEVKKISQKQVLPCDSKELFIHIGSQTMKNLCALLKIIWIAAAVLEKKFTSIKGNPVSREVEEQGWGMSKVVSLCASGEEVVWRDMGDPSGVLGLWMGVLLFDEGTNTPVPRVCQDSQSVSYFKQNSIIKSTDLCGIEVSQGHILLSKLAQTVW